SSVYSGLWNKLNNRQTWSGVLKNKHKSGRTMYVLSTIAPIFEEQESITNYIGIQQDITDRLAAEQDLIESEARMAAVMDTVPDAIITINLDGTINSFNKAAESIFGYSSDEMIGQSVDIIVPDEYKEAHRNGIKRFAASGKGNIMGTRVELEALTKSGRRIWIEMALSSVNAGNKRYVTGLLRDISEKKVIEEATRVSAVAFETQEGIFVTDASGKILKVNNAFTTLTGYTSADVVGKYPSILKSGQHDKYFYEQMWAQLEQQGFWSGEVQNRRKNGEIYPQWLSINRVENTQQNTHNYVAIMSDISKYREAEEQINFLAYHDVLTSLPNRALLKDRIGQALISAERHQQKLALLYMDLDRFKFINDSLGHAIGDKLLVKVAERLSEQVREEDTICRTGGDEFIILLPDTDADGAGHVAEKLVENITTLFEIDGNQLFVTLSIGISIYPDNGEDAESLNKHADTAMYRAKQAGRNQYQFFTTEMHSQIVYKLELEHALRFALNRGELSLVYQPLLDIKQNKITGAEALLRWRHPELGMISPLDFIPIAEETGMINPIGQWILHTAIAQCKQWTEAGHDLVIAINLSAVQFNNPLLVSMINSILDEYQLAANNLELEITESVAMINIDLTIKQLKALAEAGIRLSLDDFGTGYSSLNYLKKFPINKLKIDQSFVFDMLIDEDDEAIVDAVITLARSLGLKTLAEGVETPEHLQALKNKGCDFMQGFLFSRPVPAEQFISLLNHPPLSNLGVD
ncbi:MAG: EAL domain-containing protein, partial [Gammaproteobacteria bacterium]|nr:EAL domain-containing protein [Gammaproteobacteria bacterium]